MDYIHKLCKEESYTANDGENKNDEQKITLTNKRTGVTDAVWYKQWYDIYMYGCRQSSGHLSGHLPELCIPLLLRTGSKPN